MRGTQVKRIMIRTEASEQVGWGHLMRCIGLAEASRKLGHEVRFIVTPSTKSVRGIIREAGFGLDLWDAALGEEPDLKRMEQELLNGNPDVLVVDSYAATSEYLTVLKPKVGVLVSIDDLGEKYFPSHVVLNQNVYAEQLAYSCSTDTLLLLGTRYALLREQFEPWRSWTRTISSAGCRVLVILGGVDPDNQTGRVIEILQHCPVPGVEVVAVVGGANPNLARIQATASMSRVPVRIEYSPKHMAELMAWADVAISGGGSTCWELAFMGLPNLILVLSDNQRRVAEGLTEAGASRSLGWFHKVADAVLQEALATLLSDRHGRAVMSHCGRTLVDGRGSERVAGMLTERVAA